MAWRAQGSTGSNNIPLGNKRRFPAGDSASPQREENGYNPSQPASGYDGGFKRGRSPVRCEYTIPCDRHIFIDCSLAEAPSGDGERRRKKRNRWGDATENKAAGLMGLPTAIMANMTSEQLEAYTLHLRIEEISQKLRIDDVVPADGDRYVSMFLLSQSQILNANA
jgi:splicing factor 1